MVFTNSKGVKYYLDQKTSIIGRNHIKVETFFFRKSKVPEIAQLPIGYTVSETKTGLPVVKRL